MSAVVHVGVNVSQLHSTHNGLLDIHKLSRYLNGISIVKKLERKVGLCLHYWRVILILKRSMKPLLYLVNVDPWMDEFVEFLLLKQFSCTIIYNLVLNFGSFF